MNDSGINKNNKLAGWIDEFVNTFASKKVETIAETKIAETKTAEININDLDKIVWNDETFYVFFDESGASVINSFGNTVTTIAGVKTMEEVNERLNAKQIVSEMNNKAIEIDAEIENEINKALAYVGTKETTATTDDDQKAIDYINNGNESQEPVQTEQQTQPAEQLPQVMAAQDSKPSMTVNEPIDPVDNTLESINTKFAELEKKVSVMLDEKLAAAVEQFYARVNPGNIYDMGTQIVQEEITKFTQEAEETVRQIAEENSVDRTTPKGRYTVNKEVIEKSIKDLDIIEEVVLEEQPLEEETEIDRSQDQIKFDEEENDDEAEEEIIGEDAEIFKKASCPYCRSTLAKTGLNNNFVKIACNGCGINYKIDIETEKIYLK